MKRKKTEIFLAGLLAAALVGCGGNVNSGDGSGQPAGESTGEEEIELPNEEGKDYKYTNVEGLDVQPGTRIALVLKNLENSYWKAVKEGAEKAVEEINENLGYTGEDKVSLTVDGAEGEDGEAVDQQINTLDAVLSENPSALCLAAIDMQSCEAQMEAAVESEIPVVILDSGIESDLVSAICRTDNEAAAAEAADRLCERIGESGTVAVLSYSRRTETSMQRAQGFLQEIEENHPGVEVMEILFEDEEKSAAELWKQIQEEYPDLDGLFCTSSTVAVQVLDNLAEEKKVEIVSFDADKEQLKAVRDGRLAGTICQNPRGMGYTAVVAALRAASGETVDREIDTGYQWLDRSSLEDKSCEKYLYD